MISAEKIVKNLLSNTFDIRQGELRRALLMQLNIFLLISTLLIVKPTINSLFLSDVGIEKLPLAFILVAFGAGIITTFYSRLLSRTPLNKIIYYTLLLSVCTIILLSVLLRLNFVEKWVLYAFYIWVAVFGVLSASQFWILANIVFNAREAKRLFGFIGSGAIAGGIFGGYLTSVLAPAIGSENLLFIGAFFLVICIPINKFIWASNATINESPVQQKKRIGKIAEHPFRVIKNSRHLTYLALITAIGVLVARLVDYQFNAISSMKIPDEDELTAFFGFWYSNFNILSLLIQLFLTRKVVGVFGVGLSLFFLPTGILAGAIFVLLMPGLGAAIFIKASDGSLKQSINKSAIELLALPIPNETKNQAKTFIDVFVDSIATGISGIILITLVNGLNLSARLVSLSVVALIALWYYFAVKVRREYIALFKLKLGQIKQEEKVKSIDISKDSVYEGLKRVLESGSEKQILFVLRKINDIEHERLFNSLKDLLNHPSAEVRAEVLRKLYYYKTESLVDRIKPFINDEDQRVKVAALEYLIGQDLGDAVGLLNKHLKHPDYRVSGAALLSLANEVKDNEELKKAFNLDRLIAKRLDLIHSATDPEERKFRKMNVLKAIAVSYSRNYYSIIHKFLADSDLDVRKQAIISAGNTLDSSFIEVLFKSLKIKEESDQAIGALINFRDEITNRLKNEIVRPDPDYELMRNLPRVLEKIDSQQSVSLLFELLDFEDIQTRQEALKSLNKIKLMYPHLVFHQKRIISTILDEARLYQNTLSALYIQQERINESKIQVNADIVEARKGLITILEKRLDDNLERIFILLGLKYPPDEIETVYKGITSDKPELRVNALEFLDNLLETNLKKVLMPLFEMATLDTISKETLKNLHIRIMNQSECFLMLLQGKDYRLKLATLYLISKLGDRKYADLVNPLTKHPNQKISTLAKEILGKLK